MRRALIGLLWSLVMVAVCAQEVTPPPSELESQNIQGASLDAEGEKKFAAEDYAGALADYKGSFEVYRTLAKNNPDDITWKLRAFTLLGKVARTHNRLQQPAEAVQMQLASANGFLEIAESVGSPTSASRAATAFGTLAYYQILYSDPRAARASAERGFKLDPTQLWIKANLAHALLLSGETEAARRIYQLERTTPLDEQGTFEQVVLSDIHEFERRGIKSPGFAQVRALYAASESATGGATPNERLPIGTSFNTSDAAMLPQSARPTLPHGKRSSPQNQPVTLPPSPTASVAPSPGPAPQPVVDANQPNERQALEAAALRWLRLLDDEQFRDTYETSGSSFKQDLSRDMWVRRCRAWKSALGRRLDRTFQEFMEGDDPNGGGKRYYLRYRIRFPRGSAMETVRLEAAAPGYWQVADYSIGEIRPKE
jgi:Protein of unknown function (DUF4019)